jgi:hypothetical protein
MGGKQCFGLQVWSVLDPTKALDRKPGAFVRSGAFFTASLVLKRSPRSKKMNLATHKFITRRSWKSKTDVLESSGRETARGVSSRRFNRVDEKTVLWRPRGAK